MDKIINDPEFSKVFEDEKILYLMNHIELSCEEDLTLAVLSLFMRSFEIDAVNMINKNTQHIIKRLKNKFLLEKNDYEDGHSEYYVPMFIKNYAYSKLDETTLQKYHNQIAEYYWAKAEDFRTLIARSLEAYRLALYHFRAAGNSEKENNLSLRFKGIFLTEARCLYHAQHYDEAWKYYGEVYKIDENALDEKDLNFYLICNAKLNKPETQKLYDTAMNKYKKNPYIKSSYVTFLLHKGDNSQARDICDEILKDNPNDPMVLDLYPVIVRELEGKEVAICLIEERINYYKMNMNEKNRQRLIIVYMHYYRILDYSIVLKNSMKMVIKLMMGDGFDIRIINSRNFEQKARVEQICNSFELALKHNDANRVAYATFAKFLRRVGENEYADRIEKRSRNVKRRYKVKLDVKYYEQENSISMLPRSNDSIGIIENGLSNLDIRGQKVLSGQKENIEYQDDIRAYPKR